MTATLTRLICGDDWAHLSPDDQAPITAWLNDHGLEERFVWAIYQRRPGYYVAFCADRSSVPHRNVKWYWEQDGPLSHAQRVVAWARRPVRIFTEQPFPS